MRFKKATIYGFGKWVDTSFQLNEPELYCFYGENEAGKSTLQQFILYILFGLPPRKRARFYPKRSRLFGGSLTVEDESLGSVTIERTENNVRCYVEDGSEYDESWLYTFLNGMTREIYTSIYSFATDDLAYIQKMKKEQLSDVLFSVGLTGATSIYEVERTLLAKRDALFRKAGRVPAINKQLTLLESLEKKLQVLQEEEAAYFNKRKREQELTNDIRTEEDNLITLEKQLREQEQIIQTLPQLEQYTRCLTRLLELPDRILFPERGVERLEKINDKIMPLESELALLNDQKKQYEGAISQAQEGIYSDDIFELASQLNNEKGQYERGNYTIATLEGEQETIEGEITRHLIELGVERATVEGETFPFHCERTWQEMSETSVVLQNESEQLADMFHLMNEKQTAIKTERESIEQKLLPVNERARRKEQCIHYEETRREAKQHPPQRALVKEQTKGRSPVRTTLIGTAILTISTLVVAFLLNEPILYGIPALIVILAFFQYNSFKASTKQLQPLYKEDKSNEIIDQPTYEAYKESLELHETNVARIRLLEEKQKELKLDKREWEEKKRLFQQKESKWIEKIHKEQQVYPFLTNIEPAFWGELIKRIRTCQGLIKKLRETSEELAHLYEGRTVFQGKLHKLARLVEIDGEMMTLTDVTDIIQAVTTKKEHISHYEQLLVVNKQQMEATGAKRRTYEKEREELFLIAQVQSEEAFYKQARIKDEKNTCLGEKRALQQQLEAIFERDKLTKLTKQPLHKQALEDSLTAMKKERRDCLNRLEHLRPAQTKLELEIGGLETSEKRSEAMYRYQMERDKLQELALQWSTYEVAIQTLEQAKQSFQRKYLDGVIEQTSVYFNTLTNGAYTRVFAPTENEQFQVEAADYIRYTVRELSQGTVDQLYISLRLAISKIMHHTYPLPLMIDDAFLHFDENRLSNMSELLKDRAKRQQVILFTCNRTIATIFQDEVEREKSSPSH